MKSFDSFIVEIFEMFKWKATQWKLKSSRNFKIKAYIKDERYRTVNLFVALISSTCRINNFTFTWFTTRVVGFVYVWQVVVVQQILLKVYHWKIARISQPSSKCFILFCYFKACGLMSHYIICIFETIQLSVREPKHPKFIESEFIGTAGTLQNHLETLTVEV